jgi:hypothetical protein
VEGGELFVLGPFSRHMDGRKGPHVLDRLVAQLAERQHGVVAYWQLMELGLGDDAVQHRVVAGRLHRLYVGVYAVGHTRLTVRGRWMAAALACGPDAVLSHRDGGALWQICRTSRTEIDVTAPGRTRNVRPGLAVHRPRRPLQPDERTVHDGIPVTTVARTIVDLAAVLSLTDLRYAWDNAERQRLFDLQEIQTVRGRFKRRKGLKKIDILIAERRPLPPITRSRLEEMFVEFCARYGFPRPSMNIWIGEYEVDAVFPDHEVAVELDGRDYHTHPTAQERDPVRDVRLQILGYKPMRITYRRLVTDPDGVANDLRELLGA